jgi:hypothetical protein
MLLLTIPVLSVFYNVIVRTVHRRYSFQERHLGDLIADLLSYAICSNVHAIRRQV